VAPSLAVPQAPSSRPQPRAAWPGNRAPTRESPGTQDSGSPAAGPSIKRFSIAQAPDCAARDGADAAATLAVEAENADLYEITGDGTHLTGTIAGAPLTIPITVPCDGSPHTYHLSVSDKDGRSTDSPLTVRPGKDNPAPEGLPHP